MAGMQKPIHPLVQARHYLKSIEPGWGVLSEEETTWNITELPEGARSWHFVLIKGAKGEKGYNVFWYRGKMCAYCKGISSIDFAEVRKALDVPSPEASFPYKVGDTVTANEYGIGIVTSIHPEENGVYVKFPDGEHPFLKTYELDIP